MISLTVRRLAKGARPLASQYQRRFLSNGSDIIGQSEQTPISPVEGLNASSALADPMMSTEAAATATTTLIGKALQYGDLKAIGLCNYTPPGVLERLFEALYISAGMPWWATIATSCLLIRGALAPFAFNNFRSAAVMRQIQPQVSDLMARYKTAKDVGDQEATQRYMKELMDLYQLHGVQPAGPLGTALLTAPIFVSFFISLDKMTKLPVESFRDGGLWWFQDLTVPDPYYILPATASAIFLTNIHFNVEGGGSPQSIKVKRFFQAFTIMAAPFMAQFPAALSFYWCVNGVASLGIGGIQKIPAFRRWWGIPDLPKNQSDLTTAADSPSFMDTMRDSVKVAAANGQQRPLKKLSSSEILREALRRQQKTNSGFNDSGTGTGIEEHHHQMPAQQKRS